ncbi:MAG: hypothetical protein F6K24_18425, partial [Okeania sp. SIO2D1]|nr:hypothetical protein [Okeania sp. SIO2D1]
MIEQWVNQQKTGRRGASNIYSDVAIKLMVILSSLFGLAYGTNRRVVVIATFMQQSRSKLLNLDYIRRHNIHLNSTGGLPL